MLDGLSQGLSVGGLVPHGHCYLWKPDLVGLHVVADGVIAIAYFSIPLTLLSFVRKHEESLPFNWIFILFSIFIVSCGTTHLLEIWTLWFPTYWLSGGVKGITAIASLYTAITLLRLYPKALTLPSRVDLDQTNSKLEQEVAERCQIEQTLRESEARYRAVVEDQTELICRFLPNGIFTFVNQAYCRYFECRQEELVGHSYTPIVVPEDRHLVEQQLATLSPENPVVTVTNRVVRPDGEIRTQQWTNRMILDQQGQFIEFQAVGRDITELQQTQELQAALKEKEVLLKEVHHRVKNNLQIIYSLLRMQSRRVQDPQAASILQDSQNRVKSIALLHEKLYKTDDLSHISLQTYIPNLVASLFHSYINNPNSINLCTKIDDIFLDIDTAILCGLMINELVSNALKYAFPAHDDTMKGEILIQVQFVTPNQIDLVIGDNGIGFPESYDRLAPKTLGLSLVRDLVSQLKGTIEFNHQQGTLIKIKFPYSQS